jgi:rod shape determining protein RodA
MLFLSLPFLWQILRDYQKERLLVFLNPNIDPLGAGYTVIQSKIAIGSGGLLGKGWLAGTQSQLYFLPESHTDFIFASFAEQWGLIGSAVLLILYYLLIRQGILIALRTYDHFARLLALGISLMLAIIQRLWDLMFHLIIDLSLQKQLFIEGLARNGLMLICVI